MIYTAKILIMAMCIQLLTAGLIFWGGLLDPLLGLILMGIYFFVIGTYLIYRWLLSRYQ